VLDPGKNIGCNLGFNFGAERAKGKYLVKLDDDIVVPQNNWLEIMSKALNDFPDLAYVGLTPSDIRKNKIYKRIVKPDYTIEITGLVLFCCVMMKYRSWKKHFYLPAKLGLYGYDDVYCAGKAKKLGLRKAYLASHVCEHLRRSSMADPLYRIWKSHYAHKEKVELDYPEWRKVFLKSQAGAKFRDQYKNVLKNQ
jgi:GT2 family glycosyltransferase